MAAAKRPSLPTLPSFTRQLSGGVSNGKRWVPDDEVSSCPICAKKMESSITDFSVSGKTHCRYCGGVFCTSCCNKELLMPEEEIARPDKGDQFIKGLMVSASEKHKACINCAKILEPQQALIKANKAKKADAAAPEAAAKSVPEPYYTVTVAEAKDLKSAGTGSVFCQLSVGSTMLNTAATNANVSPKWGAALDFPVSSAAGNTLQVRCYKEAAGGNELLGDASVPLAECSDKWVKLSPSGEVKLSISLTAGREEVQVQTVRPTSALLVPPPDADAASKTARPAATPAAAAVIHGNGGGAGGGGALVFLQEHAWLVYVVMLLSVIAYKFMAMDGVSQFGGESVPLRPGTTLGNDKWLSSATHYLHMQKDGNLVLGVGTSPKDSQGIEWESGRPFPERDCPKCVAVLEKDGAHLSIKEGKGPVKTVNVADDSWLSLAIGSKKAA